MDKIWWNEQWMGWPLGPHYAASSNVDHAAKLQGQLLLIVGEMDTNVDPASTMQVVNRLIQANKEFDLLVIPNADHTGGGAYGDHKRYDFFVRHLQGRVPPPWNATSMTNRGVRRQTGRPRRRRAAVGRGRRLGPIAGSRRPVARPGSSR